MVRQTATRRGFGVPGGLLAVCFCGAVFAIGGLPSLAHADEPPACPGPALEIPDEMAQPERELRGLRNDLRDSCAALAVRLAHVGEMSEGTYSALDSVIARLDLVREDLNGGPGIRARIVGQEGGPIETVSSASSGGESVTVSNLEGVENAVVQDAETVNAALWGIAGLFCGFLLLGVLFKVVRP